MKNSRRPSAGPYWYALLGIVLSAIWLASAERTEAQSAALSCDDYLTEAFFSRATRTDVGRCLSSENINEREPGGNGNTALHLAATYSTDNSVILLILQLNADTSLRQIDRQTPLHMAATHGSNGTAVTSLMIFGADPNERVTSHKTYAPWKGLPFSTWGTTALHIAAARPEAVNIAAALLAAGATVDPWDFPTGRTPLHLAAAVPDNDAVVDILIRRGADVNATDNADNTPLHLAAVAELSDLQIIRRLLDAGANADAVNNGGQTPLPFAAARAKDPDVLTALLAETSDPCAEDEDGRTAWSNIGYNEALKNSAPFWALRQACQ